MSRGYKRIHSVTPSFSGGARLYRRGERLYVRLPDQLKLGRNKYICLFLPYTPTGVAKAQQVIDVINTDIIYERFDTTFKKYEPLYRSEAYLKEVEEKLPHNLLISDLWERYYKSKRKNIKDRTYEYLKETIGSKIRLLKKQDITKAKQIRDELLETTTESYALRVLVKIAALYDWCCEEELINDMINPYRSIIKRLKENKSVKVEPKPRPLSIKEQELILSNIYCVYRPVTKFLLLTGCRPSEAIGLERRDIKEEYIELGRSYTKREGKVFESETSKTGRRRAFPINEKLKSFLQELPLKELPEKTKVFRTKKGQPITYPYYYNAWVKVGIKDTTPYCCRDTFISTQIIAGVPPAVVAKWVDNSVNIIERHYFAINSDLKPD